MPVYDYYCTACQTYTERFVFFRDRDGQKCRECKGEVERCMVGKGPTMIPDSIPGGQIIENLDSKPTRYDSRTAIKDRMRELNVQPMVRHKGTQDGDRSKFTTRWV